MTGGSASRAASTVAPPKAVLASKAGIEAARAALAKAVAEHPANESEPEVNLRLVVDPATEETP